MSERITVKLSQPIEAHGEKLEELKLREPKGRDMIRCGIPYEIEQRDTGPVSRAVMGSVANYISVLAEIPPSSVAEMCVEDFSRAMVVVMGFFQEPSPAKSGSASSGSPGSSAT